MDKQSQKKQYTVTIKGETFSMTIKNDFELYFSKRLRDGVGANTCLFGDSKIGAQSDKSVKLMREVLFRAGHEGRRFFCDFFNAQEFETEAAANDAKELIKALMPWGRGVPVLVWWAYKVKATPYKI